MGNSRNIVAMLVLACVAGAAGCNGSSSNGGGFGTGNPAVDATLGQLESDLRSGVQTINGSITTATASIQNPNAAQIATTTAVQVSGGGGANNGSAGSVTVTVSVTRNVDGSGTVVTRVLDGVSGHEYLKQTIANNAPDIRIRIPPRGTEGLDSQGEGQLFTIVRVSTTGTITNEFNNFTPAGVSLVAFGAQPVVPTGTTVSDFSAYEEFMVEYGIEIRGVQLEAKIQEITSGSEQFVLARRGGPSTNGVDQALATFTVAADPQQRTGDLVVPIGSDATSSAGYAANSSLNLAGTVTGGVATTTASVETEVTDSITPADVPDSGANFSYTGGFSGLTGASDGHIDVSNVFIKTKSEEDTGSLTHALDATLSGAAVNIGSVEDVIYLPSASEKKTAIYLLR